MSQDFGSLKSDGFCRLTNNMLTLIFDAHSFNAIFAIIMLPPKLWPMFKAVVLPCATPAPPARLPGTNQTSSHIPNPATARRVRCVPCCTAWNRHPKHRRKPNTKTAATKPSAFQMLAAIQTHRSRQNQSATNAVTKTFLGFLALHSKYLIWLSGVSSYEHQKAMSL